MYVTVSIIWQFICLSSNHTQFSTIHLTTEFIFVCVGQYFSFFFVPVYFFYLLNELASAKWCIWLRFHSFFCPSDVCLMSVFFWISFKLCTSRFVSGLTKLYNNYNQLLLNEYLGKKLENLICCIKFWFNAVVNLWQWLLLLAVFD